MKTFSVVRFSYPEKMAPTPKAHLMGSLSRFFDRFPGRSITSEDFSFTITDLPGDDVGQLTRILSSFDCVYSIKLVSLSFFERLLGGEFDAKEFG